MRLMFSSFLDLLETLDLYSDTLASEFLVLCERQDVSDLVPCKDKKVLPENKTKQSKLKIP